MATITTNGAVESVQGGLWARLGDALYRMTMRGYQASPAYRAARLAMELNELSDEELAARGLRRSEIVQHAFAGVPFA